MTVSDEEAHGFLERYRDHVKRLHKAIVNLQTIRTVIILSEQLKLIGESTKSQAGQESILALEAHTIAIVVSYGRLFNSSKGSPMLKKKMIPNHLWQTHEEVIALRNDRYAHHGGHKSTGAAFGVFVTETAVECGIHYSSGGYLDVPPEWMELFQCVNDHLLSEFRRQTDHLTEISGKQWVVPADDLRLSHAELMTEDAYQKRLSSHMGPLPPKLP